ncbi:MAG: polysulfide reductase NrfD [Anaerolineales bacterium]|nr:polysulfide reductase NrfD [Anaerolineales bacterium]
MAILKDLKKQSFPVSYWILAAIALFGVVLGVIRLFKGLGPTTNLNAGCPWGVWIAFDFFAVPLSAGAFTLAFVSQIINRKTYHGIAHLALLAGFLGYTMVVLVLILDIGRWDQFWSVLLPWRWNLHSFMFEVSLSITLYFGVLILELLPIVFANKPNWLPIQIISQLMVIVAGVGVLLSTVHQGSIGAIFLILSNRLHPLWWTPILPILFLTSAMFSGLSIASLLAIIVWRTLKMPVPIKLLRGLTGSAAAILAVYFGLKLFDLLISGDITLVLTSGWLSVLFLAEMVIGVILPFIIFVSPSLRNERGILFGTIYVIVGLALNRFACACLALEAPAGYSYFPHWIEFSIIAAAFAAGILLFSLGVRYLPGLNKAALKAGADH